MGDTLRRHPAGDGVTPVTPLAADSRLKDVPGRREWQQTSHIDLGVAVRRSTGTTLQKGMRQIDVVHKNGNIMKN